MNKLKFSVLLLNALCISMHTFAFRNDHSNEKKEKSNLNISLHTFKSSGAINAPDDSGKSMLTIWRSGDRYYCQISTDVLGRDILVISRRMEKQTQIWDAARRWNSWIN